MLEFSEILEHFEHLYDHLPVPILVFDMHRIVRKANKAFCRLAEQDPAEATGRSINEFFEKLAPFFQQEQFLRLLPEHSRTDLSRANADPIPVRLNYCAAADHEGSVCGALVVITDLRETVQTACELQALTLENQSYRESASGKLPEEIVAEKVRLEHELNGLRSVVEGVIESCGDGILLVDLGGTIRQVNESFADMLGMQP